MRARFLGGFALSVLTAGFAFAQTPPANLPKAKPVPPKEVAPPATPVPGIDLPKTPATIKPVETPKPAVTGTTDKPATPPAALAATATTGSNILNGNCGDPCNTSCNPCATCCVPCGPPGRFWIDAGWVFWSTSGQNAPPLVTTSPDGTPRAAAGVLGQPGTSVLYPTNNLNGDYRSGFYFNFGFWFDCCQTCGFENNFFYLPQSNDNYFATCGGDGSPIISRPFFNNTLGVQDSEIVCYPNILAGSVAVNSSTDVWGINPNFIKNVCCGPCGRFDVLLGFYYLSITDSITIQENLTSLPGQLNVTPGTTFVVTDSFRTTNNFYGVNLGFNYERRFSHWYAGLRAGVALGVNHQQTEINGSTVITVPGGSPQTFAGGLLTQPSNIGTYVNDEFAVLPWVGVRFGCQVTTRLRAYVGYDYMYLSSVVRAAEQIDLRVNTTQIPPQTGAPTGPLVPAFPNNQSGFTIQGVRIGFELRF